MPYQYNPLTGNLDLVGGEANPDLVEGPASSTDNAITRFDGTTGKQIQNSNVTIDDSGNIVTPGEITVNGTAVKSTLDDHETRIDDLETDLSAVEQDVNDLVTLSGVAVNSTNLGSFTGTSIPDNSTIKAAIQALETELEAIPSPLYYAGVWDASTNTPTLANTDTDVHGAVYYVSVGGTVDFGAGDITFVAGDKVANNGTTWDKWDMTDAVASVFGRAGAVTAQSGDYTADQITNVPAGTISAITVQGAIDELDNDVQTVQSNLDDHINNTSDAHDASAISYDPSATNLSATNVQDLGDELYGLVVLPTDITEKSKTILNNQATPVNIDEFILAPSNAHSFKALAIVKIDNGSEVLNEQFNIEGINRGADTFIMYDSFGSDTGIQFYLTTGGQVQYTLPDIPDFVSGTIQFRVIGLQ